MQWSPDAVCPVKAMKCGADRQAADKGASGRLGASIVASTTRQKYALWGRWRGVCLRTLDLAWPGATTGLIVFALLLSMGAGLWLRTGLGTTIDIIGSLLLGSAVFGVATLLLVLVLALIRRVPLRLTALLLAVFGGLIVTGMKLGFSPSVSLQLGSLPALLFVMAGAALTLLLRRGPGRTGAVRGGGAALLLLIAGSAATMLVCRLAGPGGDPFVKDIVPVYGEPVAPLDVPNPAEAGPYEVATLCYGSGTDRYRPEYGEKVDVKTDSVDASPFVTSSRKGLQAWARRTYWGFGPERLPLNARVWYPRGDGPFPLVLIVHGNHRMEEFSDPGYAYLGELLASRGFILASLDENFLNFSWSGGGDEDLGLRGWLLLKHLQLWRTWNEQEGHPLYQKVDLANIALIGHSRGGEAILHAALFNGLTRHPDNANLLFPFGFQIKTLIALAPTDGSYNPGGRPVFVKNVNYLVLQGSHDGDLGYFAGARSYRRIVFTDDEYRMKAALYIHRANHGQFNTVWGRNDVDWPRRYLLNRGALLPAQDQRAVAKVYVSAFLEATLRGEHGYIPLFRDPRCAASWLPRTVYLSRFEDAGFRTIADFDQPGDVTLTTVPGGAQHGEHLQIWKRQELQGRGGRMSADCGVLLGWNTTGRPDGLPAQVPAYTITLPEVLPLGWWLDERAILSFSLADTGQRCPLPSDASAAQIGPGRAEDREKEAPIDLTVELVAADGRSARLPLSHVHPIQPILQVTFTKWPSWERLKYRSSTEPVLQTYELPLVDFVKANPDFDPGRLKQIRFRFDRTRTGVILLDDVGLAFRSAFTATENSADDMARRN